ncbi:MAG TPA: hypothetical protein VEC37_11005 [Bacillota bacterium]|nr:hypothetical protein [Bacillota bacterium]
MTNLPPTIRILEAYAGEYASGKSELAINRSLHLRQQGRYVRLVDLDLVEPFYTLRPLKARLQQAGLDVIAWETAETFGLGEAAIPLKKEAVDALDFPGDVILDLGYGHQGRSVLRLINQTAQNIPRVFLVINTTRPLTATSKDIIEFVHGFGKVDGLINNTHLGGETTADLVQTGVKIIAQASQDLGIPLIATAALRSIAEDIGPRDQLGYPVWPLARWMPDALW